MSVIKVFQDNSIIEIDRGRFDAWCIYITNANGRHAPLDWKYFKILRGFGYKYGYEVVYNDFITIYNITQKTISEETLLLIDKLSLKYREYSIKFSIILTIIYLGMVAEENKEGTRLGKRIKRLGVHQILMEGFNPKIAANYSRGMTWRQIDYECNLRNF